MTTEKYVGAIDQGTTSSRFFIFNYHGDIVSRHQLEHRQIYPRPGWVEHDPMEIRDRVNDVIKVGLQKAAINRDQLSGIGITNQRETSVVWNPATGQPYYNAIVWQDTRTEELCKNLAVNGNMDCFRKKVGLPLATYFSGPKIKWIIENIKGVKQAVEKGEALFGNMDTWLIWWLTGGPDGGVHTTDVTNASRTMLMNLETLDWDPDMLKIMGIPRQMLPEIRSSSEVYGYTKSTGVFGDEIPVSGDLGDQQAALFGQTCFTPGEAKNTYGTGCFMLLNTGEKSVQSKFGLLTTVGYKIGDQPTVYALEGSIAIAGSLVQWFRDNLGLIKESHDIEDLAMTVEDNGGIYFVPAFSGLFAPHWRSDARGLITGLTHYIHKGHIARSVIEASAYQAREIFEAMEKDSGIHLTALKVDGGMVGNELLMQFQADILDIPVICPENRETSVLGAAYAAGLAVGFWKDQSELKRHWAVDKKWEGKMPEQKRQELYDGWMKAVHRSYS
ncbi:MAG: glycerol kinase GlpK [Desulfobacteraceae bacterium]|nr:glycerol kinase GlpK [Desulfobacteraceae bacterium]MBC2756427.1 glycerol kinase GlpK [Desulfobacteraceae bacterium]MBC2763557.1 glycerol kinase GlpK [ANME-2 cluster archaeon]